MSRRKVRDHTGRGCKKNNLHRDPSGCRERFFGKYSSSSELCFGSRQLGRPAGWVMKQVIKVNTQKLSLQAAETPSSVNPIPNVEGERVQNPKEFRGRHLWMVPCGKPVENTASSPSAAPRFQRIWNLITSTKQGFGTKC